MQIYNYSHENGEYLGETTARQDPRDTKRFIIPKLATTIAPPAAGLHETPVFDGRNWTLAPDYRGTVWSTDSKEQLEVSDLGDLPEGTTELKPASRVAEWDGAKWSIPSVAQEAAAERELRKQASWLHARQLVDAHAEKNGLMLNDTVFTGNVQTVYNGLRNGLDAIPLDANFDMVADTLEASITWPVP